MREIKFKFYFEDREPVVYSFEDLLGEYGIDGYIARCEFTGLKDKNGVEIYEGNIIEWVSEDDEKVAHEVIFEDCAFYARSKHNNKFGIGGTMGSDKNIYIEVIGNIYENPKLLKSTP